jgi:class 3 adenylate cyclase
MLRFLCITVALLAGLGLFGQSISELEQQLEQASSAREKMSLNYELANAHRRNQPERTIEYGKRAHRLALDLGSDGMAARTAFVIADGYEREREKRNQEVWLNSALSYAKKAGDSDLIIKSVQKLSRLETKQRDYREAYQIMEEAFNYFSRKGSSISDLEQKYEIQRAALEREKKKLEQERALLMAEINSLSTDKERLSTEKQTLAERSQELLKSKQQVEQEITKKQSRLDSIAIAKEEAEKLAQEAAKVAKLREQEYKELSKETLAKEAQLQEARANLAEAKLTEERNQFYLLLAGAGAVFLLVLALISYGRFRASRRAKKTLEDKNRVIDEERQRSDELLLNILPAPIASELKEKGKAQARQFPEVTVLFSDFQNFTNIAERLSPEELVEELDRCFKAFDFIIGQYEDIEKIKTIGDAYMCASGLSDRKTIPNNIIRAALEMQEFLNEQRQERSRLGKPYFEARIGLHTGPVVAGVVGVNKFAYDIWGDTVNIASRVESNGEVGRVNISESTFSLVKYKFDCTYRGKLEAKNKGLLDMYFVERERVAAPVA